MLKHLQMHDTLTYRKRYYCPLCNQYALRIIHDTACECANECDDETIDIKNVIEDNDFSGYFNSEDIRKMFYTHIEDQYKFSDIFFEIICNEVLKDKDISRIKLLFNRTNVIDDRIDDLVVNHLNNNNLQESMVITPFAYIVHLIEEIHFLSNLVCKDILLFDRGIKFAKKQFYSGRFFYNNAVEHIFLAYERIFVALGIIYRFDFDDNLEKNKTLKIERYLKKQEGYKSSDTKSIFDKLKGNSVFQELKEMRAQNDHDLSYMTRVIVDDIKNNPSQFEKRWNKDGDEVDIDLYLSKLKNLLIVTEEFYNIVELIIQQVGSDESFSDLHIPMISKFLKYEKNQKFHQYSTDEINKLTSYNIKLFHSLIIYKNIILNDCFFRMNEVVHCLVDVANIYTDNFYEKWREQFGLELDGLIDTQYLLYSALFRVYATYDKISRYISDRYNMKGNIRYFKDLEGVNRSGVIFKKAETILNSEKYRELHKLRNDIYHNIRYGALYGDGGMEYNNAIMFEMLYENTSMLYELMFGLDPTLNIKVGRNEACPCGSGYKFKHCCG